MVNVKSEVPLKKCNGERISQKFILSLELQQNNTDNVNKETLSLETSTESPNLVAKPSKLLQTKTNLFPENQCIKADFKIERQNRIKCIRSLFKASDCSLISYYNSIFYLDFYCYKLNPGVELKDIHFLAILSLSAALTETKSKTNALKNNFLELSADFNSFNLEMAELEILSVMNFNRENKTSFELSSQLMKKYPLNQEDFSNEQLRKVPLTSLQKSFQKLLFFMVELTMKEFSFNKFDVEVITVSCLLCSQACLNISSLPKWVMKIADYNLESILECLDLIRFILEEVEPSILQMFHVQMQSLVEELRDRKEIVEVLIINDQDSISPWPKSEPMLMETQVGLGKRETDDWTANQKNVKNETEKHQKNVLSFSKQNESEFLSKVSVFFANNKKD